MTEFPCVMMLSMSNCPENNASMKLKIYDNRVMYRAPKRAWEKTKSRFNLRNFCKIMHLLSHLCAKTLIRKQTKKLYYIFYSRHNSELNYKLSLKGVRFFTV